MKLRFFSFGCIMIISSIAFIANSQVIDVEGNAYKTVQIGNQIWFAENLKTTKFNDGTSIPLVTDNTEWSLSFMQTKRGLPKSGSYVVDVELAAIGYCWYKNDQASYGDTYGALYNWYTVKTGKLCPSGWHVPTDDEWTVLIDYLGGEIIAYGKLKETGNVNWIKSDNKAATNESGFAARPGGFRMKDGTVRNIGYTGYWWSATISDMTYSMNRGIQYDGSKVFRSSSSKNSGFSVRCIKD